MPRQPTDIDQRYGLEPVFEPGDAVDGDAAGGDVAGGDAGSDALEQFVELTCPYCNEPILLRLDLSAGSQSYIEDCQVCCQPIQVGVAVGDDGRLEGVSGERMDR